MTTAQGTEPEDKRDRRLIQYWPYLALAVALLVIPWLAGNTAAAVPVALTCILLGPLALGYIDARQFRYTLSFPILAGVVFMVSRALFYQGAAWIYVVPVVALAWLGTRLGDRHGA